MKVISSESFQKIESLITENHVNLHARMRTWLGEKESELFAIPDFPSANSGQWCTEVKADLKEYADASAAEKEEISIFLENSKNAILPKLEKINNAANLFRVPSEKQIFWYRDEDGQVKVVLAQWGFKLCNTLQNVDVIDIIISQPRTVIQTEVIVHVSYSDDKPAANETFTCFMFNHEQDFTTDDNGTKCFGKMFPNQKISISDKYGATCEFVVVNDKNDYYARFDAHTSYQITVVSQFDEPIPNYKIFVDSVPYMTDDNAIVSVDDAVLTSPAKITVSCADRSSEDFSLSRDAEQNKFVYKLMVERHTSYSIKVVNQDGETKTNYSLNVNGENRTTDDNGVLNVDDYAYEDGEKITVIAENGGRAEYDLSLNPLDNNFIFEIKDDLFTAYTVKVVNQKGEIRSDFPLTIDGTQYDTDENGIVSVDNLSWNEGKQISVVGEGCTEQKYELMRDENMNNFVYQVEDKQVRIRALDFDGSPLGDIMVYVDTKKGTILSNMSDSEGYAVFPASAFEHGKKAKVRFIVTKEYREKRERQKQSQTE